MRKIKIHIHIVLKAILLLSSAIAYGQEIIVLDKGSSLPVGGVVIYTTDESTSVQTDEHGKADLKIFKPEALLIFQHPSYQEFNIVKSDLKKTTHTVYLDEQVLEVDEVVISANKWEQEVTEVPQEILLISSKEISYGSPQTSADVLKNTGQVYVQKSQLGGGSPILRGFAANRVLIVVDGVRMNNAIFRSGNLQNIISIDPNALESVEVVFGPGSVIYGSDALGGVMDFHTIKPGFSNSNQLKIESTAMTRYASANNEKTAHVNVKAGGKKLAFATAFSYSDFDDLKAGSDFDSDYPDFGKRPQYAARLNGADILVENRDESLQKFSGYQQWSSINKLRYRPGNDIELEYGFYYANTSDIPRYDRLTRPGRAGLRQAEWYYGPQKWSMHYIQTKLYTPTALYDEAKATLTYQRFAESRHDRRFGSNDLRNQRENVSLYTANLDMDKSWRHGTLYYGIEYTYNSVISQADILNIASRAVSPTSSRYPNGGSKYESMAVYLSHKWKVNKEVVLNTGTRFSHIVLSGSSTDPNAQALNFASFGLKNSAFNGNVGLTYNPSPDTKYSCSASTGFRSPNIDDVGKVFELDDEEGSPIVIVPNTDLKPEYSYNIELGLSHRFHQNVSFHVVSYATFLDNAIIRGPITVDGENTAVINGVTSELRAQVNTSQAYVYGGTVQAKISLPYDLLLATAFTITKGKDRTNDEPLRHTTPNFGQTRLSYQKGKLKADLYAVYNGNRFRPDIPTSEIDDKSYLYAIHTNDSSKDGSPGWYTLNLRASYHISKHLNITSAFENILDKHYKPYASGISAPGRNFIVSITGML